MTIKNKKDFNNELEKLLNLMDEKEVLTVESLIPIHTICITLIDFALLNPTSENLILVDLLSKRIEYTRSTRILTRIKGEER